MVDWRVWLDGVRGQERVVVCCAVDVGLSSLDMKACG